MVSSRVLFTLAVTGLITIVPSATAQIYRSGTPPASAGYLGVMLHEIDADRAKALNLPDVGGVEVTRVSPESPAEKAGIKTGDVVLSYNGQRVESMEQFSRLVRETPPGRDVKLDIHRNGTNQTLAVKVGRPPIFMPSLAPAIPPERFDIHMPDIPRSFMTWRSAALGVECESLQGQLADYFGVKEGVLVRSVLKGSAAERAGLKAGDVITRVGDAKVSNPADLSARIRSTNGTPIPVSVVRDHKEMTVTVTISDDDRGSWEPDTRARSVNSIR